MTFGNRDGKHATLQLTPISDNMYEARISNPGPNGHYFAAHIHSDDAWRLVQLIQDVENAKRFTRTEGGVVDAKG